MSPDIYKETILEHAKFPINHGKVKGANAKQAGANLMCGDKLEISAKLSKGKISDIKFQGGGCAISTACADILCDMAKGKKKQEVLALKPEELFKKIGFFPSPARLKCALLGLETLKKAVSKQA